MLVAISGLGIEGFSYTTGGTPPSTMLWLFGDGSSSGLGNPLYTYHSAGVYLMTVKATDSHGFVGQQSIRITVPA